MATEAAATEPRDRRFFAFNAVVSAAALSFLAWLLVFRRGEAGGMDLSFMPAVNAALNTVSTILLTSGWIAIRARKPVLHRYLMVSAFVASALFLTGYVAYHYVHGDTRYEGAHRGVYLIILATHVLLSMTVVPMALSAFFFAWRKRFAAHKKVTRVLAPVWIYVSITGVIVYFMLH